MHAYAYRLVKLCCVVAVRAGADAEAGRRARWIEADEESSSSNNNQHTHARGNVEELVYKLKPALDKTSVTCLLFTKSNNRNTQIWNYW